MGLGTIVGAVGVYDMMVTEMDDNAVPRYHVYMYASMHFMVGVTHVCVPIGHLYILKGNS